MRIKNTIIKPIAVICLVLIWNLTLKYSNESSEIEILRIKPENICLQKNPINKHTSLFKFMNYECAYQYDNGINNYEKIPSFIYTNKEHQIETIIIFKNNKNKEDFHNHQNISNRVFNLKATCKDYNPELEKDLHSIKTSEINKTTTIMKCLNFYFLFHNPNEMTLFLMTKNPYIIGELISQREQALRKFQK